MNCPECGHPAEEHSPLIGCFFETGGFFDDDGIERPLFECECSASRAEIECNAWQAEALAAREFISRIDAWCEGLSFTELYSELQVYTAARVNEKETPC